MIFYSRAPQFLKFIMTFSQNFFLELTKVFPENSFWRILICVIGARRLTKLEKPIQFIRPFVSFYPNSFSHFSS